MVVFVGPDALGSIVGARAIHVAENPERWRKEVEGMVERSKASQAALLALLKAADKHVLTEQDKSELAVKGVKLPAKDFSGTLLDGAVQYLKGKNSELTFGVYERRLQDTSIVAMCHILGRAKFGRALDEALGGRRYSGKTKTEWETFDLSKRSK